MPSFVDIRWAGRPVRIEHRWVGAAPDNASVTATAVAPLLVFLHEGLGSVSMWRNFPDRLCTALGWPGLVYSRPGYGRSTPRAAGEHLGLDFMHRQADEVLPALLDALGVQQPVVLFGHSDGGSIALLHAARQPQRVHSLVVLAPHIMVEAFGLASIAAARENYISGDLRARLARHHDDVDGVFQGWSDIWLSPGFLRWQITSDLKYIRCPVLAVLGVDDAYGTIAQIDGIAQAVPRARLLKLPHCGHSPHRDQPQALIDATVEFLTLTACPKPSPIPKPSPKTGDPL